LLRCAAPLSAIRLQCTTVAHMLIQCTYRVSQGWQPAKLLNDSESNSVYGHTLVSMPADKNSLNPSTREAIRLVTRLLRAPLAPQCVCDYGRWAEQFYQPRAWRCDTCVAET
jgi:hypothetical protein